MEEDWNMVLNSCNNSNPDGRVICDTERFEFARPTTHLQVEDFFAYNDPIIFSWDNHRRTGVRMLKRLDHF
jgi:hypothetical protein